MRSRIVLVVLFVSAFALLADAANARGGAYRGPGGMVPPGLREPSDPTPPPPPPPSTPSIRVPGTPTPTTPTTPTPPPAPPHRPQESMSAPTPRREIVPMSFEAWPFWYHHHKDMLEWPLGRRTSILPVGDTAAVHREALDAILAAASPKTKQHAAITGAGLIALGKVATTKDHVELLLASLAGRSSRGLIERESAALGLGLLRRHGQLQFLTAADLDPIRDVLFAVLASDDEPGRLRGFAGAAIGLLGDQPGADFDATTERLFRVLGTKPTNVDVLRGTLLGLLRQPAASFTAKERETLREMAYDGTLAGRRLLNLLQCDALAVLGRMGEASDLARMRGLTTADRTSANVKRSAALAFGFLAARMPVKERIGATADLLKICADSSVKDFTTRFFAMALLPRVLAGPDGRETRQVLDATLAGEVLLVKARFGHAMERPWAALTLAEILRDLPWSRATDLGPFESKAREVLRAGLGQGPKLTQAGFALALGIAGDRDSEGALQELSADTKEDFVLRSYAALGLAHLGDPSAGTLVMLRRNLTERRNETHRRTVAAALGLLDDGRSTQALAGEVEMHKSNSSKGEAAAALARLGTPEAVQALLRLSESDHFLTRAVAIAGLGRLIEPGFYPSMVLLTFRQNYRASTDLLNELNSIL